MGRFQIGNLVKASVRDSSSFLHHRHRHHDLLAPNPLFAGIPIPKIHVYPSSTVQGLVYTSYCVGAPQEQHRSRLRLQVAYWNNVAFKYTTSSNSKRNGREFSPRLLENGFTPSVQAFRLGIVSSALLAFISAGLLLHYNDERRAIPKASQGSARKMEDNFSKPFVGGPFELINHEGKLVTDNEFRGQWTMIYFGYTSSPDIDPEELQKMARVIEILESKENLKINGVFITIDPLRDSPSQLRAYLQEFHPRIMGLTGPENALRQVAQEYRVYFKRADVEGSDYLIDCSHNVYLMNPNMEFVRMFGVEYNAEQLVDVLISEVGKISKSL